MDNRSLADTASAHDRLIDSTNIVESGVNVDLRGIIQQGHTLCFSTSRHQQYRARRCRDFYRATRMHSADYSVARCLSVRLSDTRR